MIEKSFFTSLPFYVSLAVAAAIVAAGVGAYSVARDSFTHSADACRPRPPLGTTMAAEQTTETNDAGTERVQTLVLNVTGRSGGKLDLCVAVGDIEVSPSPDGNVHATITTRARTANAVADTIMRAAFASNGQDVRIGIWEEAVGRSTTTSAHVTLQLLVPEGAPYELLTRTDVGDVTVMNMRVAGFTARTDVGTVTARGVVSEGDVTLATDVGDVDAEFAAVATGLMKIHTDVGDARLVVPQRADVGYDVLAETDVGDATVNIGSTEKYVSDSEGPSQRVEARTTGYAEKPTRVRIEGNTDVGDLEIHAK